MIKRILGGLLLILAVIAGVTGGVMLFQRSSATDQETNPYEYDFEGFRNAPADLLKYAETGAIMPRLEGLHGVAVDAADRVYVVGRTALAIFDKTDAPAGGFNLAEPGLCLATDAQGSIYVGMTNHVEVFDFSGSKKASWESLGERAWITSIAVSSNQVFVADYGNRCVWRFADSGTLLGQIDGKSEGNGATGFVLPSPYFDVAADPDGSVWIANPGRQRVERYGADGRRRSQWGAPGMTLDGFCGCCNPSHLALTPDGKFITSEKGLPRVKVYDRAGRFECVVAGPDRFARDTVGLDVAVDSTGRILVLDPAAGAVRVFEKRE